MRSGENGETERALKGAGPGEVLQSLNGEPQFPDAL